MQPYDSRYFTVGNVVGESLSLYRRFFLRFFLLALVVYLAVNVLTALAETTGSAQARAAWLIAGAIAAIVGFCWLQGAFIMQVEDVRDGRIDTDFAEVFERARPRLPHLVATGLLVGLAIGVEAFLLVLGGIAIGVGWLGVLVAVAIALALLTRWMAAAPVVVLERATPFAGLRRSNAMIKGHSWRAFWVLIASSLIAGFASGILRGILNSALHGFVRTWLASGLGSAVTAPFVAVAWILVYYHLRGDARPEPPPAGAAFSDE